MHTGILFDIQRNSFVDGPGIRTTVFFKGCNLKCKWCHNPESQSFKKQLLVFPDKCTVCGKKYKSDEVFHVILKDKAFYDSSGGGVTFSGGECMLQLEFLIELLKKCKEHNIHTAIDTAGNINWSCFEQILPFTDLFLYDVKCYDENLHIQGTGTSNKTILNNLKKLSKHFNGDIVIRIPIIPGFNDNVPELKHIAQFLKSLKLNDIELLPYHKMGVHKYDALGRKPILFQEPSPSTIEELKKYFN